MLQSPITFDERFKVTPVLLFIPDCNLLNYELDNFTFKKLYAESFYINITLKQMFNILTISSGKSTIFQIAFSIKKIVVFSFKFLVKLI